VLCDLISGGPPPRISVSVRAVLADELELVHLDRPHPPASELRCDEEVDDGPFFSLKLSWSEDRVEERKRLIVPRVRISSGEIASDLECLGFGLLGLGGRLKGLRISTLKERDCGLGEYGVVLLEARMLAGDENAEDVNGDPEVDCSRGGSGSEQELTAWFWV
jgi:hypothetical protein